MLKGPTQLHESGQCSGDGGRLVSHRTSFDSEHPVEVQFFRKSTACVSICALNGVFGAMFRLGCKVIVQNFSGESLYGVVFCLRHFASQDGNCLEFDDSHSPFSMG